MLYGGDTEVFRQGKARIPVPHGLLRLDVPPYVLVSVASMALHQWFVGKCCGQAEGSQWRHSWRAGAGLHRFGYNYRQTLSLVALLVVRIVYIATREALEFRQVHNRSERAARSHCRTLPRGSPRRTECGLGGCSRRRWGCQDIFINFYSRVNALWGSGRDRHGRGVARQRHGLGVAKGCLPSPETLQDPGTVGGVPKVFCLVL